MHSNQDQPRDLLNNVDACNLIRSEKIYPRVQKAGSCHSLLAAVYHLQMTMKVMKQVLPEVISGHVNVKGSKGMA